MHHLLFLRFHNELKHSHSVSFSKKIWHTIYLLGLDYLLKHFSCHRKKNKNNIRILELNAKPEKPMLFFFSFLQMSCKNMTFGWRKEKSAQWKQKSGVTIQTRFPSAQACFSDPPSMPGDLKIVVSKLFFIFFATLASQSKQKKTTKKPGKPNGVNIIVISIPSGPRMLASFIHCATSKTDTSSYSTRSVNAATCAHQSTRDT